MTDYFSYNPGTDDIPSDAFRISPSQLSKFFDDTSNWYREHLLGEAPTFTGSTASELGTCVHAAAHMYHDSRSIDTKAINAYISSITNPEIDMSVIREQYGPMSEALVNQHLSSTRRTAVELFTWQTVIPTVVCGGSIDAYDEHTATLRDYKTMGSLDSARVPSSFPRPYWFQQMTYVWLLRKSGKPCNYAELVYISRNNTGRISDTTGKPLKDYPSTVSIVRHEVTQQDMDIIESCLKLVAESVIAFKSTPEIRHLLAQDMRLKAPAKPKIFKD